jgi:DNA-3-methyladenine glycosylase II
LSYPHFTLNGMTVIHSALLSAVPPYSFVASQTAMTGFMPCSGDQVCTAGRVRKALARPGSDDEAVVVEVAPRPDAVPGVQLMVYGESPLAPGDGAAVERAVSRWLSLSDDLRPFLARAAGDPPVRRLLDRVAGLHQVRFASLAEGLVFFTLSQRSTQRLAASRKARFAAELGARLTVDGVSHVAFPTLARLCALGEDGLLPFAGNRQRATRLAEVLAGVAALDEEWLHTAPYDEAREALLGVRGIGGFTALAILMRVLGRPDDMPLEHVQFTATAEAVYGPDDPPGPAVLRARYGATVGWWAYLCRMALGTEGARPARPRSLALR